MLKRIHSWLKQVRELHKEIIAHVPAQYLNPNPDTEAELATNPMPDERDPVAWQWTACDRAGSDLWAALVFLEGAIVERTGISVPFDEADQGGDDPDEATLPDGVELLGG